MASVAGLYNGSIIQQRPTNIPWNYVQAGQKAPGYLQQNPAWGQTAGQTSPDNPYLPALWWVGLVVILILIRVLSSKFVQ